MQHTRPLPYMRTLNVLAKSIHVMPSSPKTPGYVNQFRVLKSEKIPATSRRRRTGISHLASRSSGARREMSAEIGGLQAHIVPLHTNVSSAQDAKAANIVKRRLGPYSGTPAPLISRAEATPLSMFLPLTTALAGPIYGTGTSSVKWSWHRTEPRGIAGFLGFGRR